MGRQILAIKEELTRLKEQKASLDTLREALSSFHCKKNTDEEKFLHDKAIFFDQHNKARTYLILEEQKILAFFTLAFKSIDFNQISASKIKSLTGGESDIDFYSAFLIGHIAKDDSVKEPLGGYLLEVATDVLMQAQNIVGGRLVYIDCKNEEKLLKLYTDNGFKYFKTSEKTGLLQYYKKI